MTTNQLAQLCATAYQADAILALSSKGSVVELSDKKSDTQCYVLSNSREVTVVFRGTESLKDLLIDLSFLRRDGMHRGFLTAYESVHLQLGAALAQAQAHKKKLVFTGHSLGGALAVIASHHCMYRTHAVVTFGAPKIGGRKFFTLYRNHHVTTQYRNYWDPVPLLQLFKKHVRKAKYCGSGGHSIHNYIRNLSHG